MTYSPEILAMRRRRQRRIRELRAAGMWAPVADTAAARAHVIRLHAAGVTMLDLATEAQVSQDTLRRLRQGLTVRAYRPTLDRILAANPIPNRDRIDAVGARRRLQAIVAEGFSQACIAPRIGWRPRSLNAIVTGRRTQVSRHTHNLICDLYDLLLDETPPAGREQTYARGIAARNGWVGRDHWPSGTIDDPSATPSLEPVEPDRVVVERLTTGKIPLAAVSARADRIAAVRKLARAGLGDGTIATRVRSSKVVVTKLLAECAA